MEVGQLKTQNSVYDLPWNNKSNSSLEFFFIYSLFSMIFQSKAQGRICLILIKKNLQKGSRKLEGNDEEETIHIQQFSGFG